VNALALMKDMFRPHWRRAKHALLPRLLRTAQIQCPLEAIGGRENDPDHYGRLLLNPQAVSRDSVVYAFGIGDDISFDLALVRRFGVTVHAFDPAPRSIEWANAQRTPPEWILHKYGLADVDGSITLYPPDDPTWVSDTVCAKQYATSKGVSCPVYRLGTIMKMLGHCQVDLLKMNIEGAEYAAVADLLKSGVPVTQILISFHHRFKEVGMRKTLAAIRALNDAGFKTCSVSYNGEEVAFLDTRRVDSIRGGVELNRTP
jgi:FkbM family methyltransferase